MTTLLRARQAFIETQATYIALHGRAARNFALVRTCHAPGTPAFEIVAAELAAIKREARAEIAAALHTLLNQASGKVVM